ncbi:MAG: hypothetical protein AMJ78_09140 [Omnitrophica WOR_2 bacterium SM23_29]|nr:MAG: hypothetical protein AMJ78_09140 [Omnitrophica WOR_2 bacterium SM23_29]
MINSKRLLVILILLFLCSGDVYAYVDPGFAGSLYQLFYILIFGVIVVWVLKPFRFIKGLFKKDKTKEKRKNHTKNNSHKTV